MDTYIHTQWFMKQAEPCLKPKSLLIWVSRSQFSDTWWSRSLETNNILFLPAIQEIMLFMLLPYFPTNIQKTSKGDSEIRQA